MWRGIFSLLGTGACLSAMAQTYSGSITVTGSTFDATTQTRSQMVTSSVSALDLALTGRPTANGFACFNHSLGSSNARFEAQSTNFKLTSTLMLFANMRAEGSLQTSWTGVVSGQTSAVPAKLRFRIRTSSMINRVNGGGTLGPTSPRLSWTATVTFFGPGFQVSRVINGVATNVHDQRNTLEFATDVVTVPVFQNLTISCTLTGVADTVAYGGTFPPSVPGRRYHGSVDLRFMPGGTVNGLPNSVLELPAGYQFNSPQMSVVKNRWSGDVPETVVPSTFSVPTGEVLTGDLESLWFSDDDRLAIFNDSGSLRASLVAEGRTRVHEPSQITLTHETAGSRVGLAQTLSLYNFSLGEWVEVDGRSLGLYDLRRHTVLTSKPDDFVGWGGRVMARIDWVPINDEEPTQDGWLHMVDQLTLSLVP
ncbi:MAG TPA: hypothetical protein PKA27_09195 [Fimbriimonadaceae bacterium]|nr:hypothetical protein [Fimbriimonadaceae bacterium]